MRGAVDVPSATGAVSYPTPSRGECRCQRQCFLKSTQRTAGTPVPVSAAPAVSAISAATAVSIPSVALFLCTTTALVHVTVLSWSGHEFRDLSGQYRPSRIQLSLVTAVTTVTTVTPITLASAVAATSVTDAHANSNPPHVPPSATAVPAAIRA